MATILNRRQRNKPEVQCEDDVSKEQLKVQVEELEEQSEPVSSLSPPIVKESSR